MRRTLITAALAVVALGTAAPVAAAELRLEVENPVVSATGTLRVVVTAQPPAGRAAEVRVFSDNLGWERVVPADGRRLLEVDIAAEGGQAGRGYPLVAILQDAETGEFLDGTTNQFRVNAPPEVDGLFACNFFSPCFTDDTAVANFQRLADPDGDAITVRWGWSVDGRVVQDGPDDTLTMSKPGFGDKGQTVSVQARVSDGVDEVVRTTSFVVADTPSQLTAVELTPAAPGTDDLLRYRIIGTDADREPINGVAVGFFVNDAPRDGRAGTEGTYDLSAPDAGDVGDRIEVVATVSRRDVIVSSARNAVGVVNSAPVLTGVTLGRAVAGAPVEASVAVRDPDGDPVALRFAWVVRGEERRTVETQERTDALLLRKGDSRKDLVLTVTAGDGSAVGAPVSVSAEVLPPGQGKRLAAAVARPSWARAVRATRAVAVRGGVRVRTALPGAGRVVHELVVGGRVLVRSTVTGGGAGVVDRVLRPGGRLAGRIVVRTRLTDRETGTTVRTSRTLLLRG